MPDDSCFFQQSEVQYLSTSKAVHPSAGPEAILACEGEASCSESEPRKEKEGMEGKGREGEEKRKGEEKKRGGEDQRGGERRSASP